MQWELAIVGQERSYFIEAETLKGAVVDFAERVKLPGHGSIRAASSSHSEVLSVVSGIVFDSEGAQLAIAGRTLDATPGRGTSLGGLSIALVIFAALAFLGSINLGAAFVPDHGKSAQSMSVAIAIWSAGTLQALLLLALAQGLQYLKRIAEK